MFCDLREASWLLGYKSPATLYRLLNAGLLDDYTEYLTDQMAEYDKKAEQNNYSDYDEGSIGCQSANDDGKELHF